MSETNQPNQTDRWVILEAMGHIRVAGRYYVENGLHRVDIPDPRDVDHYRTEWYGNAAIFRITPVDEVTARKVAASSVIPDAIPWDVRHQLKRLAAPQETIEVQGEEDFTDPAPREPHYDDDDEVGSDGDLDQDDNDDDDDDDERLTDIPF